MSSDDKPLSKIASEKKPMSFLPEDILNKNSIHLFSIFNFIKFKTALINLSSL